MILHLAGRMSGRLLRCERRNRRQRAREEPAHDGLEALERQRRIRGIEGILVELRAELGGLFEIRMARKLIALMAIASRVIRKVIGLELDVMGQEPAAPFRKSRRKYLRGQPSMMIVAEGFGKIVKERDDDEFVISPRLERPRRGLQAMLIDIDGGALRIDVCKSGHEREKSRTGSVLRAIVALGTLDDAPVLGGGFGQCAKRGALGVDDGHYLIGRMRMTRVWLRNITGSSHHRTSTG